MMKGMRRAGASVQKEANEQRRGRESSWMDGVGYLKAIVNVAANSSCSKKQQVGTDKAI